MNKPATDTRHGPLPPMDNVCMHRHKHTLKTKPRHDSTCMQNHPRGNGDRWIPGVCRPVNLPYLKRYWPVRDLVTKERHTMGAWGITLVLYIHVERQTMPIIWCFWTVLLVIEKYNQHILSGDRRVCFTWVIFVHLNCRMSMEIWLYASSHTSSVSEVLFSLRYDEMFILSDGWLQRRDGYI